MDLWAMIAAERRGLADAMDGVDPDRWDTPSLCGEWTVRQLAGHLVVPFEVNGLTFLVAMAKARGNFDRANVRLADDAARRPPAELAATLRDNAEHHFTPPGHGPTAPLTDAIVHGQDFRRPLGLEYDPPADRTRAVLDFLTGGTARGFVPKARTAGLRFVATDQDATWGDGAALEGASIDLALAVTGRASGLDRLSGDGVAVLRSRLG